MTINKIRTKIGIGFDEKLLKQNPETKGFFFQRLGYERIEHACATSLEERNERLCDVKRRIEYSNKLKNEKQPTATESYLSNLEELLSSIGRENLITITGSYFYSNPKFERGMEFKLVKEKDNEFDGDAIAVYLDGEKVGYVANSDTTNCTKSSKASELKNLADTAYAQYLMRYHGSYHLARIIK